MKQFTLLHTGPSVILTTPDHLYLLPNPASPATLTLVTSAPLTSYRLYPSSFFDAQADGLALLGKIHEVQTRDKKVLPRRTSRFVRTPDGEGLGIIKEDGTVEVWRTSPGGRKILFQSEVVGDSELNEMVVFQGGTSVSLLLTTCDAELHPGQYFATYSNSVHKITLHSTQASTSTSLDVPPIVSLFSLHSKPSDTRMMIAITESHTILLLEAVIPSVSSLSSSSTPPLALSLSLHSESSLPLSSPLKTLVPVDPMAWSFPNRQAVISSSHDALLSVAEDGELAFWVPNTTTKPPSWRCTGTMRTGRTKILMAACSSAKKTVLICELGEGQEVTIWNSTESEFATGLEYQRVYR